MYEKMANDAVPVIEALRGLLVILSASGRIVACRSCLGPRFACADQGLDGKVWWEVFSSVDPQRSSRDHFRRLANEPVGARPVTRWHMAGGTTAYLEWAFKRMPEPSGGFIVMGIGQDVSSRLAAEIQMEHKHLALREENKLLRCQYRIAQLSEEPGRGFQERLQEIMEIVPQAFRHPRAVSVRIQLDGTSYQTDRFASGPQRLGKTVRVEGRRRGRLEVAYDPAVIDAAGETVRFLPQEKRFLEAVARKLAVLIAGKEADEAEEVLKEQIKHADRLATIGQLAAGIAHELNNPLADILGFAQLAYNSPDLPEQTYEDIVKIIKSALYAREVIKKILLFSRQTHLRETTANLNHLIKDWLGFIQPRCAQNNIEVVLEMDKALPDICGDPSQLNQVLVNLVVNAIHAMPDGGRLTIGTNVEKTSVLLVVKDTGTGISEEIRDKIFLPFFTTKDVDKGTGLGLSVVYGIVKEHGGTIAVDSRMGAGSSFTIRFPFCPDNR
ncbi:MAG: PAS domain-containing sensor histidine kinase [Desulfobacteraceae bacterium]|nr:MAG: PAS domain-containing sensor histidine kinase [Desulfobacteraceae bacterium]